MFSLTSYNLPFKNLKKNKEIQKLDQINQKMSVFEQPGARKDGKAFNMVDSVNMRNFSHAESSTINVSNQPQE